jgi:FAD/FMN-containing dehydrogenase/Fe-S oxidoreductase
MTEQGRARGPSRDREDLQDPGKFEDFDILDDLDKLEELELELEAALEGEVRFDETSRILYSTDASLYQIMPVGVVIPRHAEDVRAAVRVAAQHRVPILPRGSGTSLAGQTVGAALVLDFTPYMHDILELNVAERWVRVQPGVILDELNAYLKPYGLQFAPDVATSNRASIGGMMGNNSSGSHSILYGRTVEHVLEQRVVLSNGDTAWFREVGEEVWSELEQGTSLESTIYREVGRICRENADEIERRFPRIMRRSGGYNLDEFVRHGRRNLAKLLVGSEGTLAVVTEARLNLVPLPKHTGQVISHFDDMLEALDATNAALPCGPSAVELIDRIILDLTRDNPDQARARSFLQGSPEAILVTEVYAESPDELTARLETVRRALEAGTRGYAHVVIVDPASQRNVWSVRNAGLGLLMGMKGDAKPCGFVEDTAVHPVHLSAYIREFRDLLGEYDLQACYYAHASVGCLHVRPILNLKLPEDRRRMREIGGRVADLVLKYGGAMSAEHGDGLVRSEWQERMFGSQVYQAFREVKRAFDPQGLMNPGKIVDAPPMNENLRYSPGYSTINVETHFDFNADGGFGRAVELCSGVGACRKKLDGSMCPSYRATLDEQHSTRGRANMLRAVLSGQRDAPGSLSPLSDPALREVMDLCLECKACKSECPSNVDMAKLKYEFLAHYQAEHGVPLRSRLFAHAASIGPVGTRFARFVNPMLGNPLARKAIEWLVGIDARRRLPPFAPRTFVDWFRSRGTDGAAPFTNGEPEGESGRPGRPVVALLADTYTNFHEPEIGKAAVEVLEALGFAVIVPESGCCGRPLISKGLLREAQVLAAANLEALGPLAADGVPIVSLEPSCAVTYKDEYREFRFGERAGVLADKIRLFEEFVAEHADRAAEVFHGADRKVRYHVHCHQRAVLGAARSVRGLKTVAGFQVAELPSGCCGMAGAFGYEHEHYDLSLKIGEQSLFQHLRGLDADDLVVTSGTSCRTQIRDGLGREVLHPAQALAMRLKASETRHG